MIILQQAFYGREPISGYKLLAATDPMHNKVIEKLCSSIGTPDGFSEVEPFYINYIEGDYRYMIRAVIGNPDDSGRKALFFHVYIGGHDELKSKNFGIANLIGLGSFTSQYADGPLFPRSFEAVSCDILRDEPSFQWNNEKLAIVGDRPKLNLLCGMLREAVNDTNWASFTFRPLNDFKLYAISKYAPIQPEDRECVDESGNVLRSVCKEEQKIMNESAPVTDKKSSPYKLLVVLLVASMGLNAFLLLKKPSNYNADEKTVIQEIPARNAADRRQVLNELRKEFKMENRIYGDFAEELRKDNALKKQIDVHKKDILIKACAYVDFVNKNILEEKETENENKQHR